jgi:undecaprenyl-diphosphatase
MSFTNLDYHIFQMINGLAGKAAFFNPMMRFLSLDAEYLFYIGVLVYWFTRSEHNRRMVAEALISACIGLGISGLIAHFFYRDRPFIAHTVFQLIKHPANASFPSDHATGAFVIATAIWLFRKKDGSIWIFLAACIAFSRIWTGVHYPSDVLAGACIGMISALSVHQLLARWVYAQRIFDAFFHFYVTLEQKIWKKNINSSSIN